MSDNMEKVTGVGGVFFRARDPEKMAAWYRENLGIDSQAGHCNFVWGEGEPPGTSGSTVWSLFPADTDYFGSGKPAFMINYRVVSLDRMLAQLRGRGIKIENVEDHSYGRFAWITDPEGNRIELYEPAK